MLILPVLVLSSHKGIKDLDANRSAQPSLWGRISWTYFPACWRQSPQRRRESLFTDNAWWFWPSKWQAAELLSHRGNRLAVLILQSGCCSLQWGSSPRNCWESSLFPHVQFKWFLPLKIKDWLEVLKTAHSYATPSCSLSYVRLLSLVIRGNRFFWM